MKKMFVLLFVMAMLLPADSKPIKFTLGNWLWKPASNQALLTTSSPTFAGLTLSDGLTVNSGQILVRNGTAAVPSYSFSEVTGYGMYYAGSGSIGFSNGGPILTVSGFGLSLISNTQYITFGSGADVLLSRGGAAETLQMGADAAAPTDQIFKACDGDGADKPGAMLTLQGGQSTGTGIGGGVRIQTSTTSTTGSTANTEYTRYRAVGKVVTLTDASAIDVVSFAVTAGNVVGGMLVYTIDVTDDDASDRQVESGTVIFCGLQDEANWHTNISEVSTQALESGTLATTWAIDTATANTLKITCLADSDLTTPVIKVRYQILLNSPIVESTL